MEQKKLKPLVIEHARTYNVNVKERRTHMTSIEERVSIASKQFLTFSDTCRLLSVAYRTLKPDWDEFLAMLRSQGKRIPRYGVKASLVLDYFDIDYDQLMREYNFDKIKKDITQA